MRFEEEEKIIIISEEDKHQIRFNIFDAFLSNKNKLIRKQFSECIKKISKFELGNKFSFVIKLQHILINECILIKLGARYKKKDKTLFFNNNSPFF